MDMSKAGTSSNYTITEKIRVYVYICVFFHLSYLNLKKWPKSTHSLSINTEA